MKRICLCSMLVIMVLLFVSCSSNDNDSGLDEFEQLLDNTQSDTQETEEGFAKKVYIIVSQNSSGSLRAKTDELSKKIFQKTGVESLVKYDNESTVAYEGTLEILIGNTNRLRSKEMMSSLKVGEYICCWDRGSIVLGGRSEESTIEAIGAFIEKVLHGASYSSLMGENVRIEKKISYEIERITINGYDLYDYTIMYSAKNLKNERYIATVLRDYIAARSGYLLEIISDTERDEHTGKVICIGDALAAEDKKSLYNSFVSLVGQDVSVYGEGSYELSAAAATLANDIFLNIKDKKAEVDFSSQRVIEAENTALNICSAFSKGEASIEYIYDLCFKLDEQYDFVVFGATSQYISAYIQDNRGNYCYDSLELDNGDVLPILYKQGIFENVSYEVHGSIVQFKLALENGEKYCVVCSVDGDDTGWSKVDSYGYGILVLNREGNEGWADISGFCLAGEESCTVGGKIYSSGIYVDDFLVVCDQIKNNKTESAKWANSFSSLTVCAKYSDEFFALTNTSK